MPAVQGSAPQMNNNPSDYNSSNIYTLGAQISNGNRVNITGAVSGTLTLFESGGQANVSVDVEFNNFNNGTSGLEIVLPQSFNNVNHIIENTSGLAVTCDNNNISVPSTNGSVVNGFVYLVGF